MTDVQRQDLLQVMEDRDATRSTIITSQLRGQMIALEWTDANLAKRQLCVARSDWRGHVSAPKGGRIRYVPLTKRLGTRAAGGEAPPRSTGAVQ